MAMERSSNPFQKVLFFRIQVLRYIIDTEKASSLPLELPDGAEGNPAKSREERKENAQVKEAEPLPNIIHVKLNWGGDVYLEVSTDCGVNGES